MIYYVGKYITNLLTTVKAPPILARLTIGVMGN